MNPHSRSSNGPLRPCGRPVWRPWRLPAAAETGVTATEVIVGQTITLQGGKNAYGVAAFQGAKLYIDQVNAGGGVHGRKIVLRTLDDDNKAGTAEANAGNSCKDGAFILFGSIEGGPSTAIAKVAEEAGVPFFGPMAGSPGLRRPHKPMVFPVRAEHRDEFRALMTWGKETGLKTVAFCMPIPTPAANTCENVKIIAKALDLQVVLPLPFKSDISDAQVDQMVQGILQTKPD